MKPKDYGYRDCSKCGEEYWYPNTYRHWNTVTRKYLPDPGFCQECNDKIYADKYRKRVKPFMDALYHKDAQDDLLTLEDDEPEDPNRQMRFWA